MNTLRETNGPSGTGDVARSGPQQWSTGEVCRLCESEVELVENETDLYVECSCGVTLVLA